MTLQDFSCPEHGCFETLADASAEVIGCPQCLRDSPWRPAPVRGRVRLGEVVRGPNERPPNRLSLDTRKMGEGQSIDEYRAERAAIVHEHRKAEIKEFGS